MVVEELMKDEKRTTEDWEEFVRAEVNGVLDNLLPASVNGNIGIVYKNLVTEELESGPVFDETRAIGVEIVLSFDFGKEIDKPM